MLYLLINQQVMTKEKSLFRSLMRYYFQLHIFICTYWKLKSTDSQYRYNNFHHSIPLIKSTAYENRRQYIFRLQTLK